jgi:SNF2 family DNA or RNA helicase
LINPLGFRLTTGGLTGTAIQNRLSEFWCILNWAVPGKVGNKKQWYACTQSRHSSRKLIGLLCREDLVSTPLKVAQKLDATDYELTTGRERSIALVTLLLPLFWLRR